VLLTPSNGHGKSVNESREISKAEAPAGISTEKISRKYRELLWKLMQKQGLDHFFEGRFPAGMRGRK
jgi:hypothetical protein